MGLTFLGPDGTPLKMGVEEEVLVLVEFEPATGHWLWTGSLTPLGRGNGGYGRINFKSVIRRVSEYGLCRPDARSILVHRFMSWAYNGEIPADPDTGQSAVIDHDRTKCPGRPHNCCSPLHTVPVTQRLNTVRGVYERQRPHHAHGSLFDVEAFENGVLRHR